MTGQPEKPIQNPMTIAIETYMERVMGDQDQLRQSELTGLRQEIIARLDASDKAVVLQLGAAEKALTLKSSEIERRLEMLNGEAGRLATVLSQSVPREVWEQSERAVRDWKLDVEKRFNTAAGKSQMSIYITGLVIVVIQVALRFLT